MSIQVNVGVLEKSFGGCFISNHHSKSEDVTSIDLSPMGQEKLFLHDRAERVLYKLRPGYANVDDKAAAGLSWIYRQASFAGQRMFLSGRVGRKPLLGVLSAAWFALLPKDVKRGWTPVHLSPFSDPPPIGHFSTESGPGRLSRDILLDTVQTAACFFSTCLFGSGQLQALPGTGADEIISDYGTNGVAFEFHSTLRGEFPEERGGNVEVGSNRSSNRSLMHGGKTETSTLH